MLFMCVYAFLSLTGIGLHQSVQDAVRLSGVMEGSSLHKIADGMADRLLCSKSDSTNKKYFLCFKRWEQFISSHGHSPLPACPIHVALYLNHLLENNSSFSVVSSAVYSIKWVHNLHCFPDPTTNSFVQNLVESSKRTARRPVCKKEPVTSEILIKLCELFSNSNDLLVVRDLAMCLLSFSGFLRFNELSNLFCSDIKMFDNYFSLFIRKSKTDQYRFGNELVISKGETAACPFAMLSRYIQLACIDLKSDNFLFRQITRSGSCCKLIYKNKPLSYTGARHAILGRLNLVSDCNFGLHSLRAGGATVAANNDVSERCLKRHGRWKCDISKDGYVADSLDKRLNISQQLGL